MPYISEMDMASSGEMPNGVNTIISERVSSRGDKWRGIKWRKCLMVHQIADTRLNPSRTERSLVSVLHFLIPGGETSGHAESGLGVSHTVYI